MALVRPAWWLFAALALAVTAYVAVVPAWRYRVHRWEVTDTAVYTQTGWWTRERRVAPMSRIQTVDYAEGPVSRLFGLATVTVTTASAAGALEIVGLRPGQGPGAGRRADAQGRHRPGRRHVSRLDTPELDQSQQWQRLDPRMLLVHPVRELIRFLPAVIGVFLAGTASGNEVWHLSASECRSGSACCATSPPASGSPPGGSSCGAACSSGTCCPRPWTGCAPST